MITKTLLALVLLSPALLAADDKKQSTWIDPQKASKEDPDFSYQGEYHKEGAPYGVQVVALGGGKFEAYILEGGLPGLGWEKGKERIKLSGETSKNGVQFDSGKKWGIAIAGDTLALNVYKNAAHVLKRIERKSPTLGADAPKGATILFDGKNVAQWTNGQMENGLLKSTGTTSIPKFKSCQLHLEFRTPYKPFARGQGRGNSGVYFGGRWETQVLDSFALDGKMNECGGIYSIAEPSVNMCLPPLTWQTYDVDFTAAKFDKDGKRTAWPRMTVKLNGVVIHKDQELNKDNTTAAPGKGPLKNEALPVFLQNHGNPVFFRNIWVLPKE